ncbi:NAD(P)-dependent oxidoreductase [Qipengyuania sp. JC766]|uniref:NAD-dependent epimerase/dehydratase family protein n=1 Tax=Qipengyuania sp. JC766 TaxID=3232139 RepID=UPI00345B06CA
MTVAITGGTGFVGQAVLDLLEERGETARVLARNPPESRLDFDWVQGGLAEKFVLDDFVAGAETVIHIAGLTTARKPEHMEIANVTGTLNLVEAAKGAGVRRFIFVSSLAAREPLLSAYGGSKARAERIVAASGMDWTIVRPPGVYGPRDRDYLEMFKAAQKRVIPVPSKRGRSSLIHVEDLARLLLDLVPSREETTHAIFEPDDGRAGGWTHGDLARTISWAVGSKAAVLHLPDWALRLAAHLDERIRGARARLTTDRASYLVHPDWVVSPRRAVPEAIWRPQVPPRKGLRDTAEWYRQVRWL